MNIISSALYNILFIYIKKKKNRNFSYNVFSNVMFHKTMLRIYTNVLNRLNYLNNHLLAKQIRLKLVDIYTSDIRGLNSYIIKVQF